MAECEHDHEHTVDCDVGDDELQAMGPGDPQHDKWMGKHPGRAKYRGTPRPEGDLEFKLIETPALNVCGEANA